MMGNFAWDEERWPTYKKMVKDFEEAGIKTILIIEPYISLESSNYDEVIEKELYTPDNEGNIATVNILYTDAVLLDIFKKETQEWVWDKIMTRIGEDGIQGWWCDLVEPDLHLTEMVHELGPAREVHNLYSLVWIENLFKGFRKYYPEKRPFIMQRGGWGGVQRHGALFQCGDEGRWFPALKSQVPLTLSMGMSGAAYMSTDIGGFAQSTKVRPKLYARWMQFGAFTPIMRVHMASIMEIEPIYYSEEIQKILRKYMHLRYKLLPYNYTLAWEYSTWSVPMTRPMNYYDSSDPALNNVFDQYFWGRDFLVAPVVDSATYERDVYLPDGNWIDYETKEKIAGGRTIHVDAPLELLPLYVRSGSIIPTAPKMMNTKNYKGDTLIIEYYPDLDYPASEYTMYDDDGETYDSDLKGEFELLHFSAEAGEQRITISLEKEGNGFEEAPAVREMTFKVFNPGFDFCTATINGIIVPHAEGMDKFASERMASYSDSASGVIYVHFPWDGEAAEIVILDELNTVEEESNSSFTVAPNPGTGEFTFSLNIAEPGNYKAAIFDCAGNPVRRLLDAFLSGSKTKVFWDGTGRDGRRSPQGCYMLRLENEGKVISRKFEIVR